jgi:aminoglycoside/choline kinase family phosphotransferase
VPLSERTQIIDAFLQRSGWSPRHLQPLAGDASFRRYSRLVANGRRAVLMDAAPPAESVAPFMRIARHLIGLGLSAPAILSADEDAGVLLLEDFGDQTFSNLLATGSNEYALYALAIDVLAYLHRLPADVALPPHLPRYDAQRLLDEAFLFVDWYMPHHLGAAVPSGTRAAFVDAWMAVLPPVLAAPVTLVLRDFHVDNLMYLPGREGLSACGLLDFQDAVAGPAAYDLLSLLEDARRDVSDELAASMTERYWNAADVADRAHFREVFTILAAQRHCKVIGIFTRLYRRDGKRAYLAHIPRVWRMLERTLESRGLAPLADWFKAHVPLVLRIASAAGSE